MVTVIDDQFVNIQSFGSKVNMLSWVWKLSTETNTFEDDFDQIRKKEIVNDLRIHQSDGGPIINVILFFPTKNIAVSSHGWFDINSYFNFLGKNENIQSLKSYLHGRYYYTILNQERLVIQNRSVLWMMHSIDPVREPRAQIVFLIDENKFTQFVRSIAADNLNSIQITKENLPVFQISRGVPLKEADSLSLNISSRAFGWNYNMIFDVTSADEQQRQLLFLLVTCLSTLFLGPPIAFVLAYVSYRPLRMLMKHIQPDSGALQKHRSVRNEYHILENTFHKLRDDNQRMSSRIQEYRKYTKNDMLVRLLKGYFYQTKLTEDLSYYGIDYSEENQFSVLIISFTDLGSVVLDRIQRLVIARTLLEGVMEYETYNYDIIDVLGEDIIMIISDQNCELEVNGIQTLSEKIKTVLNNIENTQTNIWIGSIKSGIIGISKSYQSAKEAGELSSLAQQSHNAADIAKSFYYPTDWEVQLINNLKMGKEESVNKILDEIRLENEDRDLDSETQDSLFRYINNTIARVTAELNIQLTNEQIKKSLSLLDEETEDSQLVRQWKYIYGISSLVCDRTRKSNPADIDIPARVVEYIHGSYMSPTFSLQEISDQIGLSTSAVSKAFKKAMNINFYDYVSRLRVEKAKELLLANNLSVSKVGRMVGYTNEFSFRRAFQRYEGISVSEFRESIY
jgi:AraC-like DNA-binding protein/sugar diacid utilization regulator